MYSTGQGEFIQLITVRCKIVGILSRNVFEQIFHHPFYFEPVLSNSENIFHREMIMLYAVVDAFRLENDWEEWQKLALIIDLQAFQACVEDRLRVLNAINRL